VIVSDVVLDWAGAGGAVASAGGLPGLGASGGVWPDGVCVEGGGGAGAVGPGVVDGGARLGGDGGVRSGCDGGVGSGCDGGVSPG
jgi:hypothetical protein